MRRISLLAAVLILSIFAVPARAGDKSVTQPSTPAADDRAWVEAMKKVHAHFTGRQGTFAQFGDSITVTLAYWSPLRHERKGMPAEGQSAFETVNAYLLPECWDKWKGPAYGSDGGQTARWARQNIDAWLKKLNPEVALIMFGTNDVRLGVPIDDYEKTSGKSSRSASTMAPWSSSARSHRGPRVGWRSSRPSSPRSIRKIAREMNLPLVDYHAAIVKRRPEDWNGSLAKFNTGDEKADAKNL